LFHIRLANEDLELVADHNQKIVTLATKGTSEPLWCINELFYMRSTANDVVVKYLSCNEAGSVIDLYHRHDTSSGRQFWVFEKYLDESTQESYYAIKVSGGVKGKQLFLSIVSDQNGIFNVTPHAQDATANVSF
jgi:hypothetical protein